MILIAAAGKSGRWKNHLGVHKCMAPINGVPLIHRTIEQCKEATTNDSIGVICYDESFVINTLAWQFKPTKQSPLPYTGLGQSAEFWPKDEYCYVLLGDVVFTWIAIGDVLYAPRNEHAVTFFGHGRQSGGHHPELFAFSFPPKCQPDLLKALKEAAEWRTQLMAEKARIYMSGGWFTYRLLNKLPVFMHIITDNFIELDHNVMDLDSKEDYEKVCQLYQK